MSDKLLGLFLAYFLLVMYSPMLGFTAILDFGYMFTGHPIYAMLWLFVFGPAILFTIIRLLPKDT